LLLCHGLAALLDPLVQAVLAHAQPLRNLGNAVASVHDLIDCLDLEFLGYLCALIASPV